MKPRRAKPPSQPPSQPPSLLQQLEGQLRKQCAWLREVKEMCLYIFSSTPCQPYLLLLMRHYRDLVFSAKLNEDIVGSIKRVMDACNVNILLLDFAPALQDIIVRLRRAVAEKGGNEEDEEEKREIMRIAELLERMKLGDFMKSWDDIVEALEFYEYREELMDLYEAIAFGNRLTKALEEEILKVAAARGIDAKEVLSRLEY